VRRSSKEKGKARSSPTPSPAAVEEPAIAEGTPAPPATFTAAEIVGYEEYAPAVRRVLDQSLSLTTQNLEYKYGSADPAKGGMDCSGFVHYVLSQSGLANVPRDARDQYMWVRKAGTFQAVPARPGDSSQLDALQPGDLLFWAGAYQTGPDPDVSYTMIYLGREKGTNERLMIGAGEGRSYKGQARSGVSVFDFKVIARKASSEDSGPVFVGYARIPGLEQK
jgi:cell wall-associated NlpC family hydrolase